MVLAAIAAGGALGAPARYELALAVPTAKAGFPWSTFWINVSGSLVLGALVSLVIERWPPTRYVRPFAGIGFLGAYTTWSTFMVDTDLLVRSHHFPVAGAYVVATLLSGLLAGYTGIMAGRLWPGGDAETELA
jgi:CrcB protein